MRMLVRSLLLQLHRCGFEHASNAGKHIADVSDNFKDGGPDCADFPVCVVDLCVCVFVCVLCLWCMHAPNAVGHTCS